jgi:hypothetical protein
MEKVFVTEYQDDIHEVFAQLDDAKRAIDASDPDWKIAEWDKANIPTWVDVR